MPAERRFGTSELGDALRRLAREAPARLPRRRGDPRLRPRSAARQLRAAHLNEGLGLYQTLADYEIAQLNAWSSSVGGDDKIAQMQLTEDAEDLKDLYEEGSNLNATLDQTTATLIQNMKGA